MAGSRTAKEYWTDWLSTSLLSKIYNWWEMTQAWYLKMASGEQIGPLTEAGLKQRLEQLTDLKEVTVRQGKSQWVAADYVISKFEQLAKNGVYLYHEDKNLGPYTLDRANELIAQNPTIDFYRFGDQDDWIHIPESRRIEKQNKYEPNTEYLKSSDTKSRQQPSRDGKGSSKSSTHTATDVPLRTQSDSDRGMRKTTKRVQIIGFIVSLFGLPVSILFTLALMSRQSSFAFILMIADLILFITLGFFGYNVFFPKIKEICKSLSRLGSGDTAYQGDIPSLSFQNPWSQDERTYRQERGFLFGNSSDIHRSRDSLHCRWKKEKTQVNGFNLGKTTVTPPATVYRPISASLQTCSLSTFGKLGIL